jgi:hypothetical protein
MRQAVVLGLVLALVFGRDALNAVLSAGKRGEDAAAPPPALDADKGMSADFRVHVSFCTS